ncbi:MAG: GlcNAc-PI de-N-acetylase [Chloroflexi bacterium HGW-Chloroflexi-4]|jgi:LmbE family N-acetylglucosaminyl deacetylase|nr:MAG: GlcNAc-PI de-N-acetylase [Chloroflexi bacterium HGW-Chloroflexi-4]
MSTEKRKLLVVMAHPDDETFGTGGTLAYYASKGVEVHLICATRGEVGDVEPELLEGFDSIADLRENELRCAAETLGLAKVHMLEYRDSGMPGSIDNVHPKALAAAPIEQVAGEIVRYLRELKPEVVITFDPIGGYHHPDHIAIHNATVKAFYAAADGAQYQDGLEPFQSRKLYFHTFPKGFMKMALFFLRLFGKDPTKFGNNGDINLVPIAEANFPINARVDYRSVLEKRDKASACHVSQGGAKMTSGAMGVMRKIFGVTDQFMRAYPPPTRHIERDLFEGI